MTVKLNATELLDRANVLEAQTKRHERILHAAVAWLSELLQVDVDTVRKCLVADDLDQP
jgi:hypothetical protein